MAVSESTGAAGQRWKHRSDGHVVLLEGWIPGCCGWSAMRTVDGRTELVRDCDLMSQFVLVGGGQTS